MKSRFIRIKACFDYRRIVFAIVGIVVFHSGFGDLHAHPHVFIIQRLKVAFDEKGMAGIGVRWKFDDMFASMIAEDHDTNKNARLEPDEVQRVKEKAFSHIAEYGYFTHISIDGKSFRVKYIKDFNATLKDGRLIYEFFIPCHVSAVKNVKKIKIATYDPTYYSAIFFAKNNSASFERAETFEVRSAIREDSETSIYYGMVHPWTLFLEIRSKQ